MIYTLTANPCLDYYISTRQMLDIGRTNRADSAHIRAGGKGANVSLALKKFGYDKTLTVLVLGGRNGERIMRELCDEGLECKAFDACGESRINVKINSNDVETEINAKGPAISEIANSEIISFFSKIKSDDVLVLAGSLPSEAKDDFYAKIIEATKCKNIAVDCTKGALGCALKSGVWLVKPNIDELCEFFGEAVSWEQLPFYARRVCAMGAEYALVSAGSKGAVLACGDKVLLADAPKGRAVNSTGAGDTMLAAFVYWHNETKGDVKSAFRYAVAAGSAKAFSEGFPEKENVTALADRITVEEVF